MRGRPSHALIELVRSGLSEAGLARYVLGRPSDAGIAVDLLFHLVMLRVTGGTPSGGGGWRPDLGLLSATATGSSSTFSITFIKCRRIIEFP